MAHIIMTKVNKSEYVTIWPPLSCRSRNGWHDRPTGSPGKYIIFSMCCLLLLFSCIRVELQALSRSRMCRSIWGDPGRSCTGATF